MPLPTLVPPGAATTPVEGEAEAMQAAISPYVVAEAAIDAVVGPGADVVARERVNALLADLDQLTPESRCRPG